MNPKKQYDDLIQEIENMAQNESEKETNEMVEALYHNWYGTDFELNSLFKFMTGSTLQQYIGLRRMMTAYDFLTAPDSCNFDRLEEYYPHIKDRKIMMKAVALSGLSEQGFVVCS